MAGSSIISSNDNTNPPTIPRFDKDSNFAQKFLFLEHKRLCPHAFTITTPCPQGSNCLGLHLCRSFLLDGLCPNTPLDCPDGVHEVQHCYSERDGKMCDTIHQSPENLSVEMKAAVQEHRNGFWHMSDLEKEDVRNKSRRSLDEKLQAHLRGEYLVKHDVWGQGWVGLVDKRTGWYTMRVGRITNVKYS
jgi:hypothetical protein